MKTIKQQSAHAFARRSSAIALAVATVLSNAAFAAEGDSTSVLEEIVVTAERRPINLQDVPTSATVLTTESLEKQGVNDIVDIQQVVPGVAINTYNRGTFINIRGVGIAQSAPTSNPGVATYIDGVYIPHETFIAQAFYDIASIEVLRGPQGTLTGQNSTGGAVYMRTPAPELGKVSGYFDETLGSYAWNRTAGAINIPLGSIAAARIAAVYNKTDSYTTNLGPSVTQPGSSSLGSVRAAVLIKPMDELSFDLRYEHFDLGSAYNAVKNRNDLVTSDPFTIEEDAKSYLNQDGYRASIEGRWDFTTNMQLRVLTSRLNAFNEDQADGDRTATARPQPPNTPANVGRVGLTRQSFDTKVSEINLLSTGDQKIQWVAGAFYLTETTPVSVLRDNFHTTDFYASNSSVVAEAQNESWSGFGQFDIKFTDALALDIGARYSSDTQDYERFALPGPNPIPGVCFPCTTSAESTETTGRVGLKFFASADTMYYTTVSKGYKAGGVNLDPRLPNFGPETNSVLELGIKTEVSGGRLRINGDVFYSQYKDIQLSALKQISPTVILPNTQNGAPADIYGGELELLGKFDNLGFNVGVSYLHSEFTESQTLTNSSVSPSVDALVPSGTELPFSPPMTLSAGVEYDFHMGDSKITPRLQVSYIDEQWATAFHSAVTNVPAHTVADARVTYAPSNKLQFEAFVNNFLDETYIAVQVQEASSASGGYLYGAPRQYGARMKLSF
jgi:iron complex outermembrane receptor protein